MLLEEGHTVIALSRKKGEAHGIKFETQQKMFPELNSVSIYIRPKLQAAVINYVLDLKPNRVIFNPGTENIEFSKILKGKGIHVENACTLVLLRLGAY